MLIHPHLMHKAQGGPLLEIIFSTAYLTSSPEKSDKALRGARCQLR
jgi:hypothetical protein